MKKIKNIVIVLLLLCLIVACEESNTNKVKSKVKSNDGTSYEVIEIDSCEYITWAVGSKTGLLTHKGNCKFCKERSISK